MDESLTPTKSSLTTNRAPILSAHATDVQDVITLHEIWRVLRKRRVLVLGCLVGMVVLAGGVSAVLPRRYESLARVLVNPQDSNALGLSPLDALAGNGLSNDIVQQTQVRVLQSNPVEWDVISQLRLDQRSDFAGKSVTPTGEGIDKVSGPRKVLLLATFNEGLHVEAVPKTELIEVRFRARDPQLAANIANALTNAYIERTFRTRYEATVQASDWLSKQLDDLKKNVEASQQRFTEYQKKSGIIITGDTPNGSEDAHNIFLIQLEELNKQTAGAEGDRILREARYRVAAAGNPELIADVAPTSTLAILRAQQAELKNQYVQLAAKYGSAYPRVEQVSTQLKQVEESITRQVTEIKERFQEEYQAALETELGLKAELEKQKQEAYKMNDAGIQLAIFKRDFESSRDLYDDLMKKLKESGIVAGLHSTNVDVIDPAEVPNKPAEPRVLLNMAVGFMLGMLGGMGMAFLLESLDTTITAPENGDVLANLPVLGVVPHLNLEGGRGHKWLLEEERQLPFLLMRPDSEFAEAFRALRTTILLSSPGAPPKVILISSAAPGEGKTTVSVNIALALAQRGSRVLLVDADMRRAGVQGHLRMQGALGLSSCLAGTLDAAKLIHPLAGGMGLQILPAGRCPPNPVELLDSAPMRELLALWRKEYDHIILDTPPLVGLSDALVLSPLADAVLLVARSGRTRRQSLCRARDVLVRVNAHTTGVIINDLNLDSVDYYGYYGYNGSAYGDYHTQTAKD
jgi:polysaccharide biosynthesis transport protein